MRLTTSKQVPAMILTIGLFCFGMAPLVQADQDEIIQNFIDTDSIALEAAVEVVIDPGFGGMCCQEVEINAVIEGEVEFFASEEKWRLNSYADPSLYPGVHTEIAWKGDNFEYLMVDNGLLAIETAGLPESNGAALPMPLFDLMEHFVLVRDDANPEYTPRLADVRQVAEQSSHANSDWSTVQVDGRTLKRATFDGGTWGNASYEFAVYVKPLQPGLPVRIDRINDNGKTIERNTFTGYDQFPAGDGQVMSWPTVILFERIDPANGSVVAEMRYVIRNLRINDPDAIPTDAFSIDWSEAETVFIDGVKVK